MLLTKTILLLAAAYQVSAFNYNVTVSPNDSDVCVEVLGDETDQDVYPVKCPAVCGQLDNNEFNAGQCEGTTGSEVYAHVNNQSQVDYIRISNQYNYRFPCHSMGSNSYLCQGWLNPPSSATSSATSFVTFTSAPSSASSSANSSLSASSTSVITTSVFTAVPSGSSSASFNSPSVPSSAVTSSAIPSSILTTATSTVVTATSNSISPSSSGCIEGSKGKSLGDGYRGYCCSSNDDCWNRCKRGICNGPLTPPAAPTVTATNCNKDTEGKMKGDGLLGDCCYSSADCKEKCVKGTCNAPPS